ncbi:MAG: CHAT domain-containing tetratricopeptide repeat protein, partial [Chloroflexota bacterium]|nr:CHAT domain-containing tetratricopeptide repeat protein [Chloroflexota bacterium]
METISLPSKECPSGDDANLTPVDAINRLLELDDAHLRHCWIEQCLRCIPVDGLLSLLRAEAARYYAINSLISLRLAEALIQAAALASKPDMRVLGLMIQGDALRGLGRYQESVKVYEEAQRAFLAQGNEVGWARVHTGVIYSMHFLGRGAAALETVAVAYDVLVRHQQWLYAAKLDQNTAIVCSLSGRYDEALRHYDRAQQLFESLGALADAPECAARTKMYKAEILTLMGEFRPALALHAEAHEIFIGLGTTAEANRQTLSIADVYASQGEYTRALRLYGDAFAAFERDGQDVDAAWASLNIVACYLSLNRNTEALALAKETITRFERCGTPTEAAKARFSCALAYTRLGDSERALILLEEAVRTFAGTGLTTDLGSAMLQRARLLLGEQEWSAALEEAERAHALFAERGLVVRRTQADIIRAQALFGCGDIAGAAAAAQSILETAHARDLLWLAPEGNHILANVARAQGNLRQALAECQAAITGIERVQSRLAVELRGNFLEDKLQVFHDAIDCCLQLSEPAQALAYLERAKSRALVDYLASNPDVHMRVRGATSRELADELARLRSEHDWYYNRLYGYGITRRPDNGQENAEVAAVQTAIRDRETRIARLLERLALHEFEGGEAAEGLTPRSSGDAFVLPTLDERTVLLEYYFHERESVVFVVSPQGLKVVRLDAPPNAIRQMLQRWQLNLDTTARALSDGASLHGLARNARGILASLYRMLLQPVADELVATRCERLVIVPYGPTHAVPFHALYDGERYLLESVEVVTCPSSSLLRLCNARARAHQNGHGALVIAYSNGGQLPYVLEEAKAVSALLPGRCLVEAEATRAAFIKAAPRHGIVHLVAHGEARLDNPTFAHLRLADGQLNPADVFNLSLDGALVTLSACETGRGVVIGGDELIGLSRGFLYAGAATLVQSLWRVEDGSTARMMEQF